jgi:hypothetical protein
MALQNEISLSGFLRLSSIIGPGKPIPVSKSTWWEGVKSGRFPKPVKLGPRITGLARRGHPPADRAFRVIRCGTRSDTLLRRPSVGGGLVAVGSLVARPITTAGQAFRSTTQTMARSWCAAMLVASRNASLRFCGLVVCGRRTTRAHLSSTRRAQAPRGRGVLTTQSAAKAHSRFGTLPGQQMARWSRLISPRAACVSP